MQQLQQIRRVILVIGGYRQYEDQMTGMQRLWLALGTLRNPETMVAYRSWNSDWKQVAESIFISSFNEPPEIIVAAFSYGAGYAFPVFAKEVGKRGMHVKAAVLCDPVYRSHTWLFRWFAFVPGWIIRIPKNVVQVWWFRQRDDNLLRGHDIEAVDPEATTIHPVIELSRYHVWMDDAPEFHAKVLEVSQITPRPAADGEVLVGATPADVGGLDTKEKS